MSIQTKNCPALAISLAMAGNLRAETNNPNTGWFSRAKYGVFIHFLPSSQEGLNQVEEFDAKELFGHRAGRSPGNLRLIAFHWGTGIRRQAREDFFVRCERTGNPKGNQRTGSPQGEAAGYPGLGT